MSNVTYHGVVRGGMVVFRDDNTPLTEGTEVLVLPVANGRGSPAAVLAAVENAPRVPATWVDELESAIAKSRRPATRTAPFADESDCREAP